MLNAILGTFKNVKLILFILLLKLLSSKLFEDSNVLWIEPGGQTFNKVFVGKEKLEIF